MVIIFDLDDTLYDEISFVHSGLDHVARFLSEKFNLSYKRSFSRLKEILEENGRGTIFNQLLSEHNLLTTKNIRDCLKIYRFHHPKISVFPGVRTMLKSMQNHSLYLLTDGNKIVQFNKVKALEIEKYFRKIIITHRYGVHNAKPSVYCFEKIRKTEKSEYSNMIYIGDNPAKDFVNIRKLGIRTVRVLTGGHSKVVALPGYDAEFIIDKVTDFSVEILKSKK